jgi:hypothetical protein
VTVPLSHREAVLRCVTVDWQAAAVIAQVAGVPRHRVSALLRESMDAKLVERRAVPSWRGRAYEYRLVRRSSAGSGVVAGKPYYNGLASWPGPSLA